MILIMGMPGAGKSVQSGLIEEHLGYSWISTGNLFRQTNNPEIKAIMESGGLVEDEHVCRMVADKYDELGHDTKYLMDGFPRTVAQAEWLLEHARSIDNPIQKVLYLIISDEEAMNRLGGRGRADDSTESIAQRKKEAEKILPTIEYLREQGVEIVEIDANPTVEEIFSSIQNALGEQGS